MKKLVSLLLIFLLAFSLAGCEDDTKDPLTCPSGQHIDGDVCVDDVTDVCEEPQEVLDGTCRPLVKADCEVNELFITAANGDTYCYEDPNYRPIDGEVPVEETYCKGANYFYDYGSLDYQLVWSDEFDGTELDSTKWRYEINGSGGGNNELQYYTDQNTLVSDGTLKIIAKNESYLGMDYTSSRITTQYKETFKYGIFEARIKLPAGRGSWSAFWMMPDSSAYGNWPDSGEIDIMEHVGYDNNVVHSTVHTERFYHKIGTQKGKAYYGLNDVTSEFHTYKVEWLPDRIMFYVDDVKFWTFDPDSYNYCPTSEEWPFDRDFFMILNVAIGGDWGGAQGIDNTSFPMQMEVDYVRVYQSEIITNIEQTE